jgi:DNA-binding transcriptional LysR family regulator
MRYPRLDLNLIRVFVAIYETRSVTAAANQLFLTQPTVSYGLAKLRVLLKDPLFTRTHQGMLATPCGHRTYEQFSAAMARIASAVDMTQQFDPAHSNQRFRVAMSDIGELFFLPPLLDHIHRQAPDIEIEVVQIAMDEVVGWLAAGKADVAVGNLPAIRMLTHNQKLFTERYVCLMRAHHGSIDDRLTLERFAAARHVHVSSPFSGHRVVEDVLREHGISRKVALQIPHFTILPHLLANSELLVTLPSRVAGLFEAYGGLKALDLPISIPEFDVCMYWDERHESNAAHRWLRNVISDALTGL